MLGKAGIPMGKRSRGEKGPAGQQNSRLAAFRWCSLRAAGGQLQARMGKLTQASSLTPSVPIPQIHRMQNSASPIPTPYSRKVQDLWGDWSPWPENGRSHSQVRGHGEGRIHPGQRPWLKCSQSPSWVSMRETEAEHILSFVSNEVKYGRTDPPIVVHKGN